MDVRYCSSKNCVKIQIIHDDISNGLRIVELTNTEFTADNTANNTTLRRSSTATDSLVVLVFTRSLNLKSCSCSWALGFWVWSNLGDLELRPIYKQTQVQGAYNFWNAGNQLEFETPSGNLLEFNCSSWKFLCSTTVRRSIIDKNDIQS